MKKVIASSLVMMCFSGLWSCAATPNRVSQSLQVDDSVITRRLKTRFVKHKDFKDLDIDIKTQRGIVSLQGIVEDQHEVYQAILIAEREQGVREVKSYLVFQDHELKK